MPDSGVLMEGDVVGGPPTSRVGLGWPPAPPRPVSSGPHRDLITLTQPRPGVARKQNEYIETPLRPQLPASKSSKSRLKESDNVAGQSGCGAADVQRPGFRGGAVPITAQPTISTFKKEKVPPDALSTLSGSSAGEDPATHQDSIICRQCRKCKCQSCRTPRPLPSRWICNDKCLCSASSVVNYCTCVCCVKGLFYHWAKDYEMDSDVSCADQPCSCSPHQRCLRWGCLGFLSLALPCLCCYWPLRGCLKACETCYTRCTARGCRCSAPQHRTVTPTEQAPEKRLLDTNSDC